MKSKNEIHNVKIKLIMEHHNENQKSKWFSRTETQSPGR